MRVLTSRRYLSVFTILRSQIRVLQLAELEYSRSLLVRHQVVADAVLARKLVSHYNKEAQRVR